MSKKWKIIGIVSLVLIAFLTGISFIVYQVLNFISIEAITPSEFKEKMEELNYRVEDTTNQYSEYEYIENVKIATSKNENYNLEFYTFSSETEAITYYNYNQQIIDSSKGNISGTNNINTKKHSKYTLSSNNQYSVLIRVENTILYTTVNKEYKNKIKKAIKAIGY